MSGCAHKHVEVDEEFLLVRFTWPVRIKCMPVVGEKKIEGKLL